MRLAGASSIGEDRAVDDHKRDVELLRTLARGDQDALGEIYDRHSPRLMTIATRTLGSAEEAEDLLHDVFVEVWKKAGDYDPTRGTVRTWIAMRVRSRCLDRLRSPARRSQAFEPSHMGSVEMQPMLDVEPLERALEQLPPKQRNVICLAYVDGLSGPEISDALDIPLGTVKSRIAAGLHKLRAALGGAP